MLNTNIKLGSNSQTVTFNSPSTGTLQRSHPKSTFIRFQIGSEVEKTIFPYNGRKPFLWDSNRDKFFVMVLQVLIFGDNYYLVEVVNEEYLNE